MAKEKKTKEMLLTLLVVQRRLVAWHMAFPVERKARWAATC
jgi:hypothetical protein